MPIISSLIYFLLSLPQKSTPSHRHKFDGLAPVRNWLNAIPIQNPRQAHLLCQLIPGQCPFARDIYLFGRLVIQIPPLCKLNPLYEEVMGLRFRALCYLADECNQDIHRYC